MKQEEKPKINQRSRIGISSYAYRYSIGTDDLPHSDTFSVFDFLDETHRLGLNRAQLCENLGYSELDREALLHLRDRAQELEIDLEVGMRKLTEENLVRHLQIASILKARFIRVVVGGKVAGNSSSSKKIVRRSTEVLRRVLKETERLDVRVGIENHFDLYSEELIEIVESVDSSRVGLIFDTTNSLGMIQTPEETLKLFGPHLMSVHLKDYIVQKIEAGYLISGAILGEGWLNTESLLDKVFRYNPEAPIILEMTVRRNEKAGAQEVIKWERDAIEKSLITLRRILKRKGTISKEADYA